MLRQHKLNRDMVIAEDSSILMERLPRLPATPHLVPLLLRKHEPPPKCHKQRLWRKDLYQLVLHRPVEPASFIIQCLGWQTERAL
jgi:hypothetical protein